MENFRTEAAENSYAWAPENPRARRVENSRTQAAETSWAPANPRTSTIENSRGGLDAMIASHASANGLPEALVRRVIVRESRYNPHVVGRGGAMGLMQIKTATARGLGYSGTASGLLDPETNLTYAVRYLAGAYQLAGGNENRAVSYYARGYYYAAKRQHAQVDVTTRRYRS
jgi:soluble lytic murein transglycosylase-like protein